MLCENCGENEAKIRRTVILNGKKNVQNLCAACAQSTALVFKLPSFAELMDATAEGAGAPDKACACGMTLQRFRETGLLGCAACYAAFAPELEPIIRRAQGGRMQHVGTRPSGGRADGDTLQGLQSALRDAVAKEDYEQAAILRDRIRAMEKEG